MASVDGRSSFEAEEERSEALQEFIRPSAIRPSLFVYQYFLHLSVYISFYLMAYHILYLSDLPTYLPTYHLPT